ncbi:protein IQ-DOMAIN 3-like isoform X2 [Amaranthus tricolor]|uniref:protein IQ-DOMAIN 3-like isoform X2 n=1 Tax=Amaranthus tricolor TaxID=29722 RepID=UPI00258E0209|nr:protein IQ-DOMAIN 3-like isoform X2 [Amaranthus tricolor]
MGRKGNWLSSMKKALHTETMEKNNQKTGMSKKKWSRKKKRPSCSTTPAESAPPTTLPTTVTHHVLKEPEKLSVSDKEQTKHAYNVALTTAKAAEAAVFAAQAAAEVICLTAAPPASAPVSAGKSKEEIAALKIQTVFRGYMARRTLRALRGLMRLKTMRQGQAIEHPAANILKSMQALARVQTQVRESRQKMAEENLARQKQIQQKHTKDQAKELEKSQKDTQQNGDGNWDSSGKTKEQIEAKMQSRREATIWRERTLVYGF